jgi:hypothetical protein
VSRRTTRRPGRQKPQGRPSLFFIITLAIGILFLLWLFVHFVTQPPPKRVGESHTYLTGSIS